jgi:hypothetical protein
MGEGGVPPAGLYNLQLPPRSPTLLLDAGVTARDYGPEDARNSSASRAIFTK